MYIAQTKQWTNKIQKQQKNFFIKVKLYFSNESADNRYKLRDHRNKINYKIQHRQVYKKKLYVNLKRMWVRGTRYAKFRPKRNPILGFFKPQKRPHNAVKVKAINEYDLNGSLLILSEILVSSETEID